MKGLRNNTVALFRDSHAKERVDNCACWVCWNWWLSASTATYRGVCQLFWHFCIILILWHWHFNFGNTAQSLTHAKYLLVTTPYILGTPLIIWHTIWFSSGLVSDLLLTTFFSQFMWQVGIYRYIWQHINCLPPPSISGNTKCFLCKWGAIIQVCNERDGECSLNERRNISLSDFVLGNGSQILFNKFTAVADQ